MNAAAYATEPLITRVGSPGRAAVLTSLVAAAVEERNVRAVLTLARRGNPRSLIRHRGPFRWLALSGLLRLYPEANAEALQAAIGCRASQDRRQHEPARRARLTDERAGWPDHQIHAVAEAVALHEDHELTARWIWPVASAVAAEHLDVCAIEVEAVTGARNDTPRAIGRARKLAVYLTMTEGDVNATAMAAATGLDKSTVRHHATSAENQRDEDAGFDEMLTQLADRLRQRLDEDLSQW